MNRKWVGVQRCGGIGDNLIASSVLPLLKQKFDAVEVISKAPNHVVFENNPHIDKLSVRPENEEITDSLKWRRDQAKRAIDFDAFFDLSHSVEIELAFMEGQTQFWRSDAWRRRRCDRSYLAETHDICDVPHVFAPQFFPTEAEVTQAWDMKNKVRTMRPGPVIGWCISGSRIDKVYPYSVVAIARLITELGASVILLGAPVPKDVETADRTLASVVVHNGSSAGLHRAISPNPNTINPKSFAALSDEGKAIIMDDKPLWPIRRILAQAQLCDLLISPDTGPAWACAMADMPKIVLLSHASPTNILTGWRNTVGLHAGPGVSCWPCHRLHDDWSTCRKAPDLEAAACIADISVQAIVDTARAMLMGDSALRS